nr:hypothetical protein [Sphingobium sp.]
MEARDFLSDLEPAHVAAKLQNLAGGGITEHLAGAAGRIVAAADEITAFNADGFDADEWFVFPRNRVRNLGQVKEEGTPRLFVDCSLHIMSLYFLPHRQAVGLGYIQRGCIVRSAVSMHGLYARWFRR